MDFNSKRREDTIQPSLHLQQYWRCDTSLYDGLIWMLGGLYRLSAIDKGENLLMHLQKEDRKETGHLGDTPSQPDPFPPSWLLLQTF